MLLKNKETESLNKSKNIKYDLLVCGRCENVVDWLPNHS